MVSTPDIDSGTLRRPQHVSKPWSAALLEEPSDRCPFGFGVFAGGEGEQVNHARGIFRDAGTRRRAVQKA
jgi:hypothetical protein